MHFTDEQNIRRISASFSIAWTFGIIPEQRPLASRLYKAQFSRRQKLSAFFNACFNRRAPTALDCERQARAFLRVCGKEMVMNWIPCEVDLTQARRYFEKEGCSIMAELCHAKQNDSRFIVNYMAGSYNRNQL